MKWIGNYIFEWLRGPWPEIWFIRHGHGMHQIGYEMADEGKADSPKKALGIDVPNHEFSLSPLGRWQAEKTKEKINLKPDVVYTSQIKRAYETARIIFPGYELKYDPRLNEKGFGAAHMMSQDELRHFFPASYERYQRDGKYWAARAPDGENYIDLFIRLHSILDTLRRDWAGKKVAVVCHSAIMLEIRMLFEHFSPKSLMRIGQEEYILNCGILHYRWSNNFWGWKNGKFRLALAKPPYKLWELEEDDEKKFQREAMLELKELRKIYK